MAVPFQGTFLAILARQVETAMRNDTGLTYVDAFVDSYADYSPDDAKLWSILWTLAIFHPYTNTELAQAIVLARAGGAKLVESKKYGYMIKPDFDNEHCCWTKESYAEIQAVFRDHENDLLEILKRLAKEQ